MKFNSTVALTFVLLVMMLSAGAVSGVWGYTMGREALKGVTQPNTSPAKKLTGKSKGSADSKNLKILLKEEEIFKAVREHIDRNSNPNSQKDPEEKKKDSTESDSFTKKDESEEEKSTDSEESREEAQNLPIQSQDRGVTMEVTRTSQENGSLLLAVNLQNESAKTVRFLYSFLEVKDDKGRTLSAITDGLPGELPNNGKNFSGVVKIPSALLENASKLSITLTDYPDQKLQLNLSGIPVEK
ncbi:hypothetical protein [Lusitaniella coriacea]|uniref:hypothetical protein n=1 Tax=Lusitaniella coriacea TaxID=1983105 RepID=UPI003CF6392D